MSMIDRLFRPQANQAGWWFCIELDGTEYSVYEMVI